MMKGRVVNRAIMPQCRAKMPKLRLIRRRSANTSPKRDGCACASSCSLDTAGSGVQNATTAMLDKVSRPVMINRPFTPMTLVSIGDRIRLAEKVMPMLKPIIAIERVRTSSRVRSASNAVTAALTAPAPCNARPMTSISSESAEAARKLPAANSSRPK